MFRSKPPRHSHPPPLSSNHDLPSDYPRTRKRVPWRRIKSGATDSTDHLPDSVSDDSLSAPPPPSATSSIPSVNTPSQQKASALKRLSTLFKESDGRLEENLRSLKRRVVQVRRQPDEAPVRFQLGFRSRTGWEPIRATKENQDCLVALVPWGPASSYNLFAALDGHGRNGHQCAIFVAQKVVSYLSKNLVEDADDKHIAVTMHKAIAYAERKLESPSIPIDYQLSGSTGVFVIIHGTTLFCANVGDSRAVIGREKDSGGAMRRGWHTSQERPIPEHSRKTAKKKGHGSNTLFSATYIAVPLSVDQKPSRPDEKERLLEAGARVDAWEGVDVGEERVWLPEARTPGLAVSRSFGDLLVKQYGVSCTPEVCSMELSADDRFIVMASDGVFEFMPSEEVVDIVGRWRDRGSAQEAAEELVKLATERWIDDDSVIDDISCIVVFMNVVSPEVSSSRDPVYIETEVGIIDTPSEVDRSPSSRNLSQQSLPDELEILASSPSPEEASLLTSAARADGEDLELEEVSINHQREDKDDLLEQKS
eukprot:GFKZ01006768.1.p1 GENE.GFKZ01006768.1~~GFKZ01006768.1.p1  ORF type:complete len:537 (-),score=81.87 GFKZ01006768.1:493-2103(-)